MWGPEEVIGFPEPEWQVVGATTPVCWWLSSPPLPQTWAIFKTLNLSHNTLLVETQHTYLSKPTQVHKTRRESQSMDLSEWCGEVILSQHDRLSHTGSRLWQTYHSAGNRAQLLECLPSTQETLGGSLHPLNWARWEVKGFGIQGNPGVHNLKTSLGHEICLKKHIMYNIHTLHASKMLRVEKHNHEDGECGNAPYDLLNLCVK